MLGRLAHKLPTEPDLQRLSGNGHHRSGSVELEDGGSLAARLLVSLRRGGFGRSVLTLMSGTVVAQVLAVASAPVIARLYRPEDFGVFAIFATVLLLFGPLVSVRYELAIVPARDDDDAFGLLVLSCLISLAVGILTAVAIVRFDRLRNALGLTPLVPYRWIIPMAIVCSGIYEAFRQFCIRREQYKRLSYSQIVQSGVSVTGQIAGGAFIGWGSWGLLLGQFVGTIVSIYSLAGAISSIGCAWRQKNQGRILATLQSVAVRHRNHPLYLPWGGFLDALAQRLPVLLLSVFYGPRFLGLYALADRLLRTPIYLVGQASSQVLFQKMTMRHVQMQMPRVLMLWALAVTVFSAAPFAALYFLGQRLFSFLLGTPWAPAGDLAGLLIPMYWGILVVSPISALLIVANRQGVLLGIQTLFLMSSFCSLWLSHRFLATGNGAVLCYSLSQLGTYVVYFLALLAASECVAKKPEVLATCVE